MMCCLAQGASDPPSVEGPPRGCCPRWNGGCYAISGARIFIMVPGPCIEMGSLARW